LKPPELTNIGQVDGKKDLFAGLKELEEEGPFDVGEAFIKREREEEERWRSIWLRPDVSENGLFGRKKRRPPAEGRLLETRLLAMDG